MPNKNSQENKIKIEKIPCVVSRKSFQGYVINKMQKKINEQLKKGKNKETKGKENKVCQPKFKKPQKIVRYSSENSNSNCEIKYDSEYIEETEENGPYNRKFLPVKKHKN